MDVPARLRRRRRNGQMQAVGHTATTKVTGGRRKAAETAMWMVTAHNQPHNHGQQPTANGTDGRKIHCICCIDCQVASNRLHQRHRMAHVTPGISARPWRYKQETKSAHRRRTYRNHGSRQARSTLRRMAHHLESNTPTSGRGGHHHLTPHSRAPMRRWKPFLQCIGSLCCIPVVGLTPAFFLSVASRGQPPPVGAWRPQSSG